jgi:hypothetical protein
LDRSDEFAAAQKGYTTTMMIATVVTNRTTPA